MFGGETIFLLQRGKFIKNGPFCEFMDIDDVLHGYRIIKPIGAGGGGYLYQAEKDGLEVCLKECRFGLRTNDPEAPEVVRLFEREVSTLSSLNHPGIPKYYDSFSSEETGEARLYLAMELVQGKNLAELLVNKRISLEYVIKVAREIAETLTYTHAFVPPIIHRDIKPENIIQPDEEGARVRLVDFGSVTGAVLKRTLATHNTVAGTPGYAAPETWHAKECAASDIYSLGATLLYLLSTGRTPGEWMNDDYRLDFKGKLTGVPAWLEQLVWEMTEQNVTKRIRSAGELLGRLHYGQSSRVQITVGDRQDAAEPLAPSAAGLAESSPAEPGHPIYGQINYSNFGQNVKLPPFLRKKRDILELSPAIERAINPIRAVADQFGRNLNLVESAYSLDVLGNKAVLPTLEGAVSLLTEEPAAALEHFVLKYTSGFYRLSLGYLLATEYYIYIPKQYVHGITPNHIGLCLDQISGIAPEEYSRLINAVNQGLKDFVTVPGMEKKPTLLQRLLGRKE